MADRECGNPVVIEAGGSVAALAVVDAPSPDPLTELQHRFIDAFIANGGRGEGAAIEAGYGGGAGNMALRNLAKPKIQSEIMRRLKLQGGTALAAAIGRLLKVIESSQDDKAAVAAALGLMDRFGMAPPNGPAVAIQVNNVTGQQAANILVEVAERRAKRLASSSGE